MLVLSRKAWETIVIGEGDDKVTITIMKIRETQVRIGIEAPKHVKILRGELSPDEQEAQDQRPSLVAHTVTFSAK